MRWLKRTGNPISPGVMLGIVAWLSVLSPALAHSGPPPTPDTLWASWSWDPSTFLILVLLPALYATGTYRLWQRVGTGRGVRISQVIAFSGAILTLFVALVTPLEALGHSLFSAHMVQHLLLILVVAPLLVLARPAVPMLWGLPSTWRREVARLAQPGRTFSRVWHWLTNPLVAFVIHAVAIWVWHLPYFYDLAVEYWAVHVLEHVMFLSTAMFFWWSTLPLARTWRPNRYGWAVLSLFVTVLHSGALAAIITFSGSPWFESHALTTQVWGLTPMEDQQLAGLIMWVPMGTFYVVTVAILIALWFREISAGEQDDHSAGVVELDADESERRTRTSAG